MQLCLHCLLSKNADSINSFCLKIVNLIIYLLVLRKDETGFCKCPKINLKGLREKLGGRKALKGLSRVNLLPKIFLESFSASNTQFQQIFLFSIENIIRISVKQTMRVPKAVPQNQLKHFHKKARLPISIKPQLAHLNFPEILQSKRFVFRSALILINNTCKHFKGKSISNIHLINVLLILFQLKH